RGRAGGAALQWFARHPSRGKAGSELLERFAMRKARLPPCRLSMPSAKRREIRRGKQTVLGMQEHVGLRHAVQVVVPRRIFVHRQPPRLAVALAVQRPHMNDLLDLACEPGEPTDTPLEISRLKGPAILAVDGDEVLNARGLRRINPEINNHCLASLALVFRPSPVAPTSHHSADCRRLG